MAQTPKISKNTQYTKVYTEHQENNVNSIHRMLFCFLLEQKCTMCTWTYSLHFSQRCAKLNPNQGNFVRQAPGSGVSVKMNVWIFTKENEKAPHAVLFEQQLSVEGWHHYVIYWPRQPPHRPRVRPGPGVQISGGRHRDTAARRNWDVRNINDTVAKIM